MARRPLEREQVCLDGGRRTTQLMRDSLASAATKVSQMPRDNRQPAYATLAAIVLLVACASYSWRLAPAVIDSPQAGLPAVQAPDSVFLAADVTVIVWTRSGGCTRRGRLEQDSDNNIVTIRVFDSILVRAPSNTLCPDVLRHTRNQVNIRFSRVGTAILRAIGTDTVERTLVVR